jgi:outer membrane protein assembly factor BamB
VARTGVFNFPAIRQLPGVKWQTELDDLFMGTPLVADGVLYSGGSDGSLYALDAGTGEVLWSAGGFEIIETATAIAGDVIIGGGGNNLVRALDRRDGHPLWSFRATTFVFAAPLIVGDRIFIATYDKLHALDLQTGELLWEADTGDEMAFVSAPAFAGDTIFVASGPRLLAFDASTGEERWRVESATQFWGLALAPHLVLLGNSDGYLYAYDQASGRELWKYASRFGGPDDIWSSPAAAGDTVYVGSRDGFVYALDAATGRELWEFETSGDSVGDPVVSVDAVYVSDSNHLLPPGPRRLHALDAATGQPLWTYEVDSTLLTTPALGPGAIYVTITGAVIALE